MAQSATRKIAYNTGVQIAGKVLVTIVAAASIGISTRYLGPEDYGKFTIALVFLSFFSIAADLGLFTIVVQKLSEKPEDSERILGNALSLRTLLSIVVMLVAIGVGFLMPYATDVKTGIAIASLALIFGLLNSSLVTLLQARLRMDYSVIADLVGRLTSFGAVVVVAAADLGYYAIVATAVVGGVAQFIVTNYFVRKMIRIRWLRDYAYWKMLFVQSLPLGLSIALTFIYFRLDTLILSLLRSTAEVGIYGAAFKVLEILLAVSGFFVNSVFTLLSSYLAKKDARVQQLVQTSFDSLLLFSVPLCVGVILLGGQIIRLVAGDEFSDAGLALQLLAPALVFSYMNALLGYMLVAKRRLKVLILMSLGILVVNVVLNVLTIPTYGFRAAALNTVASEMLVFIAAIVLVKRYYGFTFNLRTLPRAAIASTVMGIAVWLTSPAGLLIQAVVGMGVYGAGIYVFNGPGKELIRQVRSKGRTA